MELSFGALRTRSPSAQRSSWEPLPTSMGFKDSGAQTDRQASQTLATWSCNTPVLQLSAGCAFMLHEETGSGGCVSARG